MAQSKNDVTSNDLLRIFAGSSDQKVRIVTIQSKGDNKNGRKN